MKTSYLDHAATSPMPGEVLESYIAALKIIGNPASTHSDGQNANALLEQARRDVAKHLGAELVEVIFTSGGTESLNLAIKGSFFERRKSHPEKTIILIPLAEHHASLEAVAWLEESFNAQIHWLPVNEHGVLTPRILTEELTKIDPEKVALLTFLLVNNEVGSIADAEEIVKIAHAHDIAVHVDAVAALGQLKVDFKKIEADLLSISAHKIGGPVGVGALLMSRSAKVEALFHGGSQQRSRAGSQDVAGAVAFARALDRAYRDPLALDKIRELRDHLVSEVLRVVPEAHLRGASPEAENARVPGNAHFTFSGCQGDSLLFLLDARGVSVSVGSACQAGVQEISHVLLAMGLPEAEAIGSLRITLSQDTTLEEVKKFLAHLPQAVADAKKAGITSIDIITSKK